MLHLVAFSLLVYVSNLLLVSAATAPNATRITLDRILRTYEWQQYSFQAISCRNTPYLNTVCSEFYPGTNIPTISDISVSAYPDYYGYFGTEVGFYGFSYANYTTLESSFINVTAQALYYYCQVNTTCAAAYKATPNISVALYNVVSQNSAKIKALLPKNNLSTWIPNPQYANALSYFTTFPYGDQQILGIQESLPLASSNYSVASWQAMNQLRDSLSQGAEMYESLLNHLALLSLNVGGNTTTYKRRQLSSAPVKGGSSSLVAIEAQRRSLKRKISSLRGRARMQIRGLHSDFNKKVRDLSFDPLLNPRSIFAAPKPNAACDILAITVENQYEAINYASDACQLVGVPFGFFDFNFTTNTLANSPYTAASSQLSANTRYYFNKMFAAVSFVNYLCTLLPGDAPCYPSTTFWSTTKTVGSLPSKLFDAFNVTSAVNAKMTGPTGIIFNIECAIDDIVQQGYANAVSCCKQNCNSAACYGGSSESVVVGLGC